MVPFQAIGVYDPSTIRTFILPAHGTYVENEVGDPIMWFVAPESMIQGL